jgi:hypothetical protein
MSCPGIYLRCVCCSFYNHSAGEYNLWYKLRKLKRLSCDGCVECNKQEAFLEHILMEIGITKLENLIPGQIYKLKTIHSNEFWSPIEEIRLTPITYNIQEGTHE